MLATEHVVKRHHSKIRRNFSSEELMQKRTLMLARGISPAAFCSCAGACSLPIPLG